MFEVRVNFVEIGGVGYCYIVVIGLGYVFGYYYLLFFGWVYIVLVVYDQFGVFYGVVVLDFWVVVVIVDDQVEFYVFGVVGDVGGVVGVLVFNWVLGNVFVVFLYYFVLVVDQYQGVVGGFVWMFFVVFVGE